MTEKLSIAGILQAAMAMSQPEDPRIFVALAERIAAINGMSLGCSQLYDLPHAEIKGVDFAELD